jgi:hypothetical protein
MIKFLKIAAVAGAVLVCAGLSAHFTKSYISEVAGREKTLAELILAGEAAKTLDEAAAAAEREVGKEAITVTTAPVVTTAPAFTTPAETAVQAAATVTEIPITTTAETTVTTVPETTVTTETTTTTAPIVTDYKIGGLIDTSVPPATTKTILTLTAQEQQYLNDYLVKHYFLDGFTYAEAETNPAVKARKTAAAEMESAAIQTVNMIMESINLTDPTKILDTDFDALIKRIEDVEAGFHAAYDNQETGDMQALYDGSIAYFTQLKASLGMIKQVQTDYKNASNALLAASLAGKALSGTVIPEVMNILESSFALVEASQPIFLENTTGHVLLTRDEVRSILINPGYIF